MNNVSAFFTELSTVKEGEVLLTCILALCLPQEAFQSITTGSKDKSTRMVAIVDHYNEMMDRGDHRGAEMLAAGAIYVSDGSSDILKIMLANARNARRMAEYEQDPRPHSNSPAAFVVIYKTEQLPIWNSSRSQMNERWLSLLIQKGMTPAETAEVRVVCLDDTAVVRTYGSLHKKIYTNMQQYDSELTTGRLHE